MSRTRVSFEDIVQAQRKQKSQEMPPDEGITLCFDPGHTTGWAVFVGLKLVQSGQIDTSDLPTAIPNITGLFDNFPPDIVVIEDYRVYEWRAKHHAGSELLTTQVLGAIQTICIQRFVSPIIKQPAHIAKGFCTDKKLKDWHMYKTGERHARDAIRHGAYFLIFGAIRKADKPTLTVG